MITPASCTPDGQYLIAQRTWRSSTWQVSVFAAAVALIACLVIITFAASYDRTRQHWGEEATYEHGWPWRFGVRDWHNRDGSLTRFLFWKELLEFELQALLGDIAVLLVASSIVVMLGRRLAVNGTFSLRTAAVAITLICIACGHFVAMRRAAQAEMLLTLSAHEFEIHRECRGPIWLQRLVGDCAVFGDSLDRVVRVHVYKLRRAESMPEAAVVLAQLPYLRVLRSRTINDDQLTCLLRARRTWPIEEFHMTMNDQITSAGLAEIDRCPHLRIAILHITNVDDRAMEYLSRCPQLEFIGADCTKVTVASVDAFGRMPRLKHLGLQACEDIHCRDHDAFRQLNIPKLLLSDYLCVTP